MITIHHNFDEKKFKWLWAKYVTCGNIEKHCQACIHGRYSKKFSATTNTDLIHQPVLQMDEQPEGSYKAIYFCGVIKKGYPKSNYPHNVHFAVVPEAGRVDMWDFENWHVEIDGGYLSQIPAESDLNRMFFEPPYTDHYYTCRIFRWMLGFFYPEYCKPVKELL